MFKKISGALAVKGREIITKIWVDLTAKVVVGGIVAAFGAGAFYLTTKNVEPATASVAIDVTEPKCDYTFTASGEKANASFTCRDVSMDDATRMANTAKNHQPDGGLGPGIKNARIGMTLAEIKKKFTLEESKGTDLYPAFPGYYNAKEVVQIGGFKYSVTFHFDPDTSILEFISLHQWFNDGEKVPDFAEVEMVLSSRYGTPLDMWFPREHDPQHKEKIWVADNGTITLNNWFKAKPRDVIRNSSIIYFHPSSHGKKVSGGAEVNAFR